MGMERHGGRERLDPLFEEIQREVAGKGDQSMARILTKLLERVIALEKKNPPAGLGSTPRT